MLVQRAYRSKFKNKPCPTAEAITKLSKKFDTTGTILDLPSKPKKERDIRVDARNKLKVLFSDRLSIRKASVDVEISYSLCRDILLKDLQLKPYKYQSAHQLLSLDYEKRVIFAQWWLDLEKDAHKWFIATDEAYFYLTESINMQNNRMCLNERPEDWIEKPLHDDAKVLVWCAIFRRKI